MKNAIIVAATILCLSFPVFAQDDNTAKPKLSASGELDFSGMNDRQMTEFIASQLYLLNRTNAIVALSENSIASTIAGIRTQLPKPINDDRIVGLAVIQQINKSIQEALQTLENSTIPE